MLHLEVMHCLTWLRLSCGTHEHTVTVSVHQWSLAPASTQMSNDICHGAILSLISTYLGKNLPCLQKGHVSTRSSMARPEVESRP